MSATTACKRDTPVCMAVRLVRPRADFERCRQQLPVKGTVPFTRAWPSAHALGRAIRVPRDARGVVGLDAIHSRPARRKGGCRSLRACRGWHRASRCNRLLNRDHRLRAARAACRDEVVAALPSGRARFANAFEIPVAPRVSAFSCQVYRDVLLPPDRWSGALRSWP
jgi:hypothetical protein